MSEIKELYNRKDQMIHFTLADGMVRGLLCTAVNTVAKGAAIHCASASVSAFVQFFQQPKRFTLRSASAQKTKAELKTGTLKSVRT